MTASPDEPMSLAADFPEQSHESWQRLVAAVLNKSRAEDRQLTGEQAEASMRTRLAGGLEVDPLYLREDAPGRQDSLDGPGRMALTRGRTLRDATAPWDVRQLHDDPDAAATHEAVLADLENGVTSVWLHLGEDGLPSAKLNEVLADVHLDMASVVVSSWEYPAEAARALLAVAGDRPVKGLFLGLDPIGAAARTGTTPDFGPLEEITPEVVDREGVYAMTVDATVYHDAGASEVDEIAFAAATAVAYLRALTDLGIEPARAVRQLEFRVAATADQFLTAAMLRALRRVWARIAELSGVPEQDRGALTHAVTSRRMLSRDDPWVNVLRGTLACFGASLGDADAITVLPYDTVAGLPTPFSRRLARNTQTLLAEESNVGRVTDPAGGSWYVESLTDQLARAAWTAFQEIEAAGGMPRALAEGLVARRIGAARAERADELAHRTAPLTGVSMFPLTQESPLQRTARVSVRTGDGALVPVRDAAAYEALRDRAAAAGSPAVRLVTLGEQRDFGAREAFVRNLLAAGGIGIAEDGPIAVLASSPKGYAAHAASAIDRLRGQGASEILLAGRAKELGDATDAVDGEIYDGMDVVAFLSGLLDRLGAPTGPTTKGAGA